MTRSTILIGFVLMGLLPGLVSNQAVASDQPDPKEAEAVEAEDLVLLEERTRMFRITDGNNLGERLELSLRLATDEEPGEWVLEFSDLNTVYLSVDDGAFMMVRLELPSEGRAVVYDPPVRMVPAEIRPHIEINEESTAQVYDLETGELKQEGTVHHEVKFATRSEFTTDVGKFEGFMIPIEQEIHLPGVKIVLELTGGYVPERGIVYRRVDYTRRAFVLFGKTIRRTAVLSTEED